MARKANEKNENVENVEKDVEKNHPWKFRRFKASDVSLMAKVISKIGLKDFKKAFVVDKAKAALDDGKKLEDVMEDIGAGVVFEIIEIVLENMERCENDIFRLLASVTEQEEDSIREMSLADYTELIYDFFHNEGFVDFTKVVLKFLK